MPVAFMPYMSATFGTPFAGNPYCSAMRWMTILTIYPYIAVAIPAMIARHPYVSGASCWDYFDWMRWWGAYTNNDLGICSECCTDAEGDGCGCNKELLLHDSSLDTEGFRRRLENISCCCNLRFASESFSCKARVFALYFTCFGQPIASTCIAQAVITA